MPMNWCPSISVATPVEPLPKKGSIIRLFGGVISFIRYLIRLIGLTVGWLFTQGVPCLLSTSVLLPSSRSSVLPRVSSSCRFSLFGVRCSSPSSLSSLFVFAQ